ncbi:hypothetical protein [Treponema sp.]|uniref:pectate lyase family protein n=1 Tax=Treponema sp. TaxID=166 RepID=UPI0025CDE905|nr:hypothetical protein [Treponema sp.]MBR4322509.1 hypothetical protein [Treponema sp.]
MKKINKLFAVAALLTGLLGGFTGCSDISNNDSVEQTIAYGRVAFTASEELSNIVFKGTKDSKTTTFGSWATADELKNAEIAIPVGSYTFYLTAEYAGVEVSGSTSGEIKENETTALSFTLSAEAVDIPEDNDSETKIVGTLVTEGTYAGKYLVMDWNASDYLFGRTTVTTDSDKAVTAGTYGDVTVLGSAKTNVTKDAEGNLVSGGYIQLGKNGSVSNCLKFAVPVNVSYITVNGKCGSSSASSVKMTICTSDGTSTADFTFKAQNESNENIYAVKEFEYSLTAAEGETQKVVCLYNSDSTASLNIRGISVYAPTKWEKTTTTISTKTGTSENADTYEPESQTVTVDMTVSTEASATGSSITIKKAEGWLNSAYVVFDDSAASYKVTCDGNAVDNELIRHYSTYKYNELTYKDGQSTWTEKSYSNVVRVDVLGLTAGSHTISITPAGGNATTVTANVLNSDRSGYAFNETETPGAYNKDGSLKSKAKVIYVTKDNAKTVSVDITTKNGTTTYTGLQNILRNSTLKTATTDLALDIRVIGKLSKDDLDAIDSSAEGLQIKNNYNSSKNYVPITIEGVGHDATLWGFGFLIRDSKYIEIANLGIMCFMDDGVSLDTNNLNTWIHNLDVFYGSTGGDSDQAKGDGSLDTKGNSTYQSYSYLHFWDSGKCNLCGMKSESASNRLTYHHNWYDHSDSRHPRIRTSTVHIYNNYFDGNAKYGVGVTTGASAFVESNFFRNPHDPMMSSGQGTDATGDGTFSGETGGIIKAYNNKFYQLGYNGVKFQFMTNLDYPDDNDIDCYVVTKRSDTVPSTVKAVSGGATYNNFDTSEDLYLADGSLTEPDAALTNVLKFSGRHNPDFAWTFDNATEDANYGLIKELKAAVVAYQNAGLTKVGQ